MPTKKQQTEANLIDDMILSIDMQHDKIFTAEEIIKWLKRQKKLILSNGGDA